MANTDHLTMQQGSVRLEDLGNAAAWLLAGATHTDEVHFQVYNSDVNYTWCLTTEDAGQAGQDRQGKGHWENSSSPL